MMNQTTIPKARPLWHQKPWAISCVLALLSIAPGHSQSADNFKPALPQPAALDDAKAAPKTAAVATEPVTNLPSRYVGEAELEPYIASFTAIFSMRRRDTDPFGQVQDPNAKPIIKTPIAKTTRVATMQATPFADIIRLIKVTTVMPSEKKFLIGTRSVKQGDRIPLTFRGRKINVEVASVSSQSIEFRNTENGETASVSLNLLPSGMTPGNDGITAPGMTLDRPDAPLDLDDNSLSMEPSRNR
jgi:hypothetical protein